MGSAGKLRYRIAGEEGPGLGRTFMHGLLKFRVRDFRTVDSVLDIFSDGLWMCSTILTVPYFWV